VVVVTPLTSEVRYVTGRYVRCKTNALTWTVAVCVFILALYRFIRLKNPQRLGNTVYQAKE